MDITTGLTNFYWLHLCVLGFAPENEKKQLKKNCDVVMAEKIESAKLLHFAALLLESFIFSLKQG